MSASAVRMGRAFVEIGADATKLFNAINKANARMGRFASGMRSVGANVMAMGTALAAPIVAAAATGSRFEDVLLNMRAATNMTADEMKTVRAAALSMSEALGVGPIDAANGFLELVKAGVPLETVLAGVGQAAVQFATVGQMAVADAAVVMADAMKVFGVTGNVAADTLSSAADASSTSIEGIAQAFTQVSAVAGLANQSIQDTAAALAILANNGVKGSDAGTSLKTMLLRLMTPTDEAAQSLASIGLSVDSFRGADGKVKPLAQVIGVLNTAMAGMDQVAKDKVFAKIFGQDAIRAAAILTTAGVDGFGAMRQSMNESLGVGDKFDQLMSGISGTAARLFAALQRVAIAITEALGPSINAVGAFLAGLANIMVDVIAKNQSLVTYVAGGVAAFLAIGAAIYGAGVAIGVVSGVLGVMLNMWVLVPTLIGAAVVAVASFTGGLTGLSEIATTAFQGIYDAIVAGDLAGAMEIAWLGLQAVFLRGIANFMGYFEPWIDGFLNTFTYAGTGIMTIWESMWSGLTQTTNTIGAVLQGTFDNIVNGVMATWDAMVAAVRKSWNYVQSFIVQGYDLAAENAKVDDETSARAAQRAADRPGIAGRMAKADAENQRTALESQQRIDAMNRQADDTAQARLDDNMAGRYGQAADDAQAALAERSQALADKRAADAQAAAEKVQGAEAAAQPAGDGAAIQEALKAAGVGQSQSETAGTFSAAAVAGMGFGQSLAQKQTDLLSSIDQGIGELVGQGGGGVAP